MGEVGVGVRRCLEGVAIVPPRSRLIFPAARSRWQVTARSHELSAIIEC